MDKVNHPIPSFEDIVADLSRPLTAYIVKMVGHSAEGDDLLQETLIRIAKALPTFEGRSSIKTWAYRIATNVAIDYLRKKKKANFVEFDEKDNPIPPEEEDRLTVSGMNQCLREVINTLPPEYRSVIVLYNLEEKSVDEIAEICDTTVGNVKIRIHRGKKRLQRILERQCDFYETAKGNFRCSRK